MTVGCPIMSGSDGSYTARHTVHRAPPSESIISSATDIRLELSPSCFHHCLTPVGLADAALAAEQVLGLEVWHVTIALALAGILAGAPLRLVAHLDGPVLLHRVLEAAALAGSRLAESTAARHRPVDSREWRRISYEASAKETCSVPAEVHRHSVARILWRMPVCGTCDLSAKRRLTQQEGTGGLRQKWQETFPYYEGAMPEF